MTIRAIYTLDDLETLTGVKKGTIRSWVAKGIIPCSYGKGGRGPHWGEEHLRAIRRVLEIKDQQVTFADLRARYGYKPMNDGFDDEFEPEPLDDDYLDTPHRFGLALDPHETRFLDSLDTPRVRIDDVYPADDDPISQWGELPDYSEDVMSLENLLSLEDLLQIEDADDEDEVDEAVGHRPRIHPGWYR